MGGERQLIAIAKATGNLSSETRWHMQQLAKQIRLARPYLENTFELSNAFYLAVELMQIGEELDRCLY